MLTGDEARLCGIETGKNHIVIYPEWASPATSYTHKHWTVKQILFKGFYEELVLTQQGVTLRILNAHEGRYAEGDTVQLKIRKYLEY